MRNRWKKLPPRYSAVPSTLRRSMQTRRSSFSSMSHWPFFSRFNIEQSGQIVSTSHTPRLHINSWTLMRQGRIILFFHGYRQHVGRVFMVWVVMIVLSEFDKGGNTCIWVKREKLPALTSAHWYVLLIMYWPNKDLVPNRPWSHQFRDNITHRTQTSIPDIPLPELTTDDHFLIELHVRLFDNKSNFTLYQQTLSENPFSFVSFPIQCTSCIQFSQEPVNGRCRFCSLWTGLYCVYTSSKIMMLFFHKTTQGLWHQHQPGSRTTSSCW